MSGVPYTFASATSSIPLSELDSNFATPVTIGTTSVTLGNTVTTLANVSLSNVTISSVASVIPNNFVANSSVIVNGTSNVAIASANGAVTMVTNGNTAVTLDTSGNLLVNTTSALTSSSDAKVQFYTSIVAGNNDSGYQTTAGYHQLMYKTAEGNITNMFGNNGSTGFNMSFRSVASYGANGAASGFILGKNSSTNRSINAGGTINASGADYAEYMTKAGAFTIAKGNVVGINAEGKLTNVFADAISFCVKSTNPSYVGGDVWGSDEVLGLKEPKETSSQEEKDAFNEALEIARQTVDRIAFAGQVPVNVTGATAGQYIVPIANQDGSIGGQAVSESAMTLQQYMQSVGKVISVVNNVTTIIAKVA